MIYLTDVQHRISIKLTPQTVNRVFTRCIIIIFYLAKYIIIVIISHWRRSIIDLSKMNCDELSRIITLIIILI